MIERYRCNDAMQADLSLNLPHLPCMLHHGDTIDEIDEEPHHLSQSARSRLLGVSGRSRSIARCRQLDDPSTYVVAFFSDISFFSGTFSGELSALLFGYKNIVSGSVRRAFDVQVTPYVCPSNIRLRVRPRVSVRRYSLTIPLCGIHPLVLAPSI